MPAYVFDKKKNELVKVAGNAANADLKDMNVYSTEEKIVGTWIDGKPIYRKVLSANIGAVSTTPKVIGTVADFKTLVNLRFILKGETFQSSNTTFSGSDTSKINVGYIDSDGTVKYKHFVSSYNNGTVTAIVEYTKTTD